MCIAINSASSGVTLFAYALSRVMTLLSFQTCVMAVADPIALTLPSVMTAISANTFHVLLNAMLSFDE